MAGTDGQSEQAECYEQMHWHKAGEKNGSGGGKEDREGKIGKWKEKA